MPAIKVITDLVIFKKEYTDDIEVYSVDMFNQIRGSLDINYNPVTLKTRDEIKSPYLKGFYEVKITFRQYQEVDI